jgi:hypothetical protein
MGDSMSTIINATTTNGVVIQPDNSGSLVLQTNSGTTALTIDTSQRAAFVAGTAAAPAITTTGDTNTGMFFPAADTIAFAEGGTEAMRLNSSGNVGIGQTTNPGYRLLVKQSGNTSLAAIGIASVNSANDTYIGMGYSATSDTCFIQATYDTTGAFKPLSFSTSDTERMRIDTSGRVLYKTTSAPVNFSMFRAVGASCDFSFGPQDQAGQTSFSVWNASTVGVYLVSGNTSWTGTSDGTLKNVTSKVTDGLNKVISMNPVYYSWKESEDNKQHIGFIAQEMEKIEPTVVEQNGGLYGINYTELIPVLTAAIQEQQTIINDLKARVETLEAKLG